MNALNKNEDFRGRPHPTRYELIDRDGNRIEPHFESPLAASEHAKRLWPGQEQDEDRTGKGWDIQVCGNETGG